MFALFAATDAVLPNNIVKATIAADKRWVVFVFDWKLDTAFNVGPRQKLPIQWTVCFVCGLRALLNGSPPSARLNLFWAEHSAPSLLVN